MKSRAKYFGVVSGAAGLGAAAGPLIGGLVTTTISWRASFGLQVLVVAWILFLARRITEPVRSGRRPRFDLTGAVLCAAGLFFIVFGILQSATYGFFAARKSFTVAGTVIIPKGGVSPVWLYVGVGVVILAVLVLYLRHREGAGREPLIRLRLLRNRTANLGLVTQLAQWLTLQGSFFVISVFLQEVRKYSAIETGLMLTPAIAGMLLTSAAADRFARRHSQRWLIIVGFVATVVGLALLLALVRKDSGVASFIPGLFIMGAGVGVMLTSSVNVVQSSFPDADQGDISGVSRSASNLGSSLGTALAGSVLVAAAVPGGKPFAFSLVTVLACTVIGLAAAVAIPRRRAAQALPER
jgi:predicted MFS family arabinose efflux permease